MAALPLAEGSGTTVWWAHTRPLSELDLRLLDRDERFRLDRQRTVAAQERSAVARVLLRLVLADRLGLHPAEVPMDWSAGPRVLVDGGPGLSLSHSGHRVVVAVSDDGPVGIDLEPAERAERIRPGTVERLSAPGEIAGLETLQGATRRAAALELWTAKEALLKATGDGLTLAPGSVEVAPVPGPARLLRFDRRPELVGRCHLQPLRHDPDWVGSVAVLADAPGGVAELDGDLLLAAGAEAAAA